MEGKYCLNNLFDSPEGLKNTLKTFLHFETFSHNCIVNLKIVISDLPIGFYHHSSFNTYHLKYHDICLYMYTNAQRCTMKYIYSSLNLFSVSKTSPFFPGEVSRNKPDFLGPSHEYWAAANDLQVFSA